MNLANMFPEYLWREIWRVFVKPAPGYIVVYWSREGWGALKALLSKAKLNEITNI